MGIFKIKKPFISYRVYMCVDEDDTETAEKYNFKLVTITGGGNSGRECGPLHSHGFEGTMPKVIKAIKSWSEE